MKRVCGVLAVLGTVVLFPAGAQADGAFFEVVGGIAQPVADDEYDDVIDTSLKTGLRIGGMGGGQGANAFGVELGLSWSPLNDEYPIGDVDVHRFRATIGIRAVHQLAESAALVARLAGGVDHIDASFEAFGVSGSEDDTGLVIDPGFGVMVGAGGLSLGGYVGLPMAFHDEEGDLNIDYTAIDIDFLFALGTAF